jgi:hypothetical protein
LQIKRAKLERDLQVEHPLVWFRNMMARTCSFDGNMEVVEIFESPMAMKCTYPQKGRSILITPLSPDSVHRVMREKHGRISKFADGNPLFYIPRTAAVKEISLLIGGFMFDLELPLAWSGLTGQDVTHMDRIWVYELS